VPRKVVEGYSLYERACNFSEKILPISPPPTLKKRLQEAIEFAHLKITPRGPLSLLVLTVSATIGVPIILALLLHTFTLTVGLIIFVVGALIFYLLYDYPFHYATVFRIRASAEMVLTIVYMAIAMRISPNLERAVEFASRNLTGPLAYDLKKLLWEVHARKYLSVEDALDVFIRKWRRENEEFTDALHLIKIAVSESPSKREQTLDEAISTVLSGTRERMASYARELKPSLTILNALGILLPIIGMIFFPMIGVLLPQTIQPIFIVLGYNVLLPMFVYWLMKSSLEKRPYTFHQPDLSVHPEFVPEKMMKFPLTISLIVSLPMVVIGVWQVGMSPGVFSFDALVYSLLITCGIAAGFVSYTLLSGVSLLALREDIARVEDEFVEVSYHLGTQLTRGLPIEAALRKITPRIKELKTAHFFNKILYNIETFGMTLERAVFDSRVGAIRVYPSRLIRAVMRALVEISKRGMRVAAKSMLVISRYLKDVRAVQERLMDMLEDVTSTMRIQAMLLAPLTAGIAVSLAATIMQMMLYLKEAIEAMYAQLAAYGPLGNVGGGILEAIINLDKMIPIYAFQLIVGVYTLQVVALIAIFVSLIQHGEENVLKRLTVGKMLLLATAVYAFTTVFTFSAFSVLIPIVGVVG
jgi:hypothetical protein